MTALSKSLAGAVIGAGILAFSAVSASAGIACVGLVCWHTQSTYEYPSESRVVVHEDSWKWGPSEKYSFREHEGRGYWKGDSGRTGKMVPQAVRVSFRGRLSWRPLSFQYARTAVPEVLPDQYRLLVPGQPIQAPSALQTFE